MLYYFFSSQGDDYFCMFYIIHDIKFSEFEHTIFKIVSIIYLPQNSNTTNPFKESYKRIFFFFEYYYLMPIVKPNSIPKLY